MAKEEAEANTLLQRELTELNEHREIDRYLLSIGKVILNLETKLARLETANEKLIDALEQSEETTSTEEFQFTLDEDAELTDEVIDKLSQLKLLKEEVEKRQIKIKHLKTESKARGRSTTSTRANKTFAVTIKRYGDRNIPNLVTAMHP